MLVPRKKPSHLDKSQRRRLEDILNRHIVYVGGVSHGAGKVEDGNHAILKHKHVRFLLDTHGRDMAGHENDLTALAEIQKKFGGTQFEFRIEP